MVNINVSLKMDMYGRKYKNMLYNKSIIYLGKNEINKRI